MIEIIYANERYFPSFHEALSVVAKERIYIEMIEAPPPEMVASFQRDLISRNGPAYYAINENKVVGWCDVFPEENPRQSHRGSLGMGLLPEVRGKGIGSLLLQRVIEHARAIGLEKIELNVYTSNAPAIALYEKFGFEQEGLIRKYRKLDGRYFDCLVMGKLL